MDDKIISNTTTSTKLSNQADCNVPQINFIEQSTNYRSKKQRNQSSPSSSTEIKKIYDLAFSQFSTYLDSQECSSKSKTAKTYATEFIELLKKNNLNIAELSEHYISNPEEIVEDLLNYKIKGTSPLVETIKLSL